MKWRPICTLVLAGIFLHGCGGSREAEAVSSHPTPPPVQQPQPKAALPSFDASHQLAYLQSFLRLAGMVRYHYPGDAAATTHWDAFLAESLYRIGIATDASAAEQVIWQQLSALAPDLQLNQFSGERVALTAHSMVRAYRQNGYASPGKSGNVYSRSRVDLPYGTLAKRPELPQQATYRYNDGLLRAEIPLLVAVQNGQTQPQGQPFTASARYTLPEGMDHIAGCLSAAGQLWSLIDNFYPYFHQVEADWRSELTPMLQSCLTSDRQVFIRQLHLSMTKLQDNHVGLFSPYHVSWLGNFFTPVRFDWIEGRLLAIYREPGSDSVIELGDELLSVDGQPAPQGVEQLAAVSLRSEHRRRNWAALFYLLRGSENQPFRLQLRRQDGSEYQAVLTATAAETVVRQAQEAVFQPQTPTFRWLTPQIAYLNLSLLKDAEVSAVLTGLQQARAVVLDLRRYPDTNVAWRKILPRLTRAPAASLPMHFLYASHPDYWHRFRAPEPQFIQPETPLLKLQSVVLSSRYSISNNEHLLGYLQSMAVPVMGEATYGINGNVTQFDLMGGVHRNGLSGYFTGMQVSQHDGSRLIGRGIQPDLPVPVTAAGLREGRDEQLAAAQAWLAAQL